MHSIADLLRFVAISEIGFSVGYVLFGMIHQQNHYLRWLAVSYIAYGVAAIDLLVVRLHKPLTWWGIMLLIGGTVAVATQIYYQSERERRKKSAKSI